MSARKSGCTDEQLIQQLIEEVYTYHFILITQKTPLEMKERHLSKGLLLSRLIQDRGDYVQHYQVLNSVSECKQKEYTLFLACPTVRHVLKSYIRYIKNSKERRVLRLKKYVHLRLQKEAVPLLL